MACHITLGVAIRLGASVEPGIVRSFIGNRPSRCNFLRASLRARRMAGLMQPHLLLTGAGFSHKLGRLLGVRGFRVPAVGNDWR